MHAYMPITHAPPTHTHAKVKGADKIMYGYDHVTANGPPTELIIVEGEMDVLALAEAGIHHAISVPDGKRACEKPHMVCLGVACKNLHAVCFDRGL